MHQPSALGSMQLFLGSVLERNSTLSIVLLMWRNVLASLVAEVVLDMRPGRVLVGERFAEEIGTTSVVIRKNWNDTEKISMAPAQG